MSSSTLIISLPLLLPAAGAAFCALIKNGRAALIAACAISAVSALLALVTAGLVFIHGTVAAGSWLRLDALSAFHLVAMGIVFLMTSLYAPGYFANELRAQHVNETELKRFGMLWLGAQAAMALVLISNNVGAMWVGIEATTLLTAFLICIHRTPASLEAMWKYLIICSVGVAFAFMGTLLVGASTAGHLPGAQALEWTALVQAAPSLNTAMLKLAFLFLLVGFGTKAGLAPMHTWLPDAHSQAPAPVSALFSGFLLNCAMYCLLRYIPIVEGACGHSGWSLRLLALFGLISLGAAAIFIGIQRDVKRLLAYSTVEHMGVIALGVGLGAAGTFAALFHALNHSITKSMAFLGAGRVGQAYGTHDISKINESVRKTPVWGIALFAGLLGLIGVAPLPIFMSEFLVAKSAVDGGSWWKLGIFLAALALVFVGALRHAINMAWGRTEGEVKPEGAGRVERIVVLLTIGLLLALGCWMPDTLREAISGAAQVIGGGR